MYNLILNPGSTSTKIGIYRGTEKCFTETIQHSQEELGAFSKVIEQEAFRTETIEAALTARGISFDSISGVISIGGLIRPGTAGIYEVNPEMLDDLIQARYYEHAANVGALIANHLAKRYGFPAYIADAITVDEMQDVARISGLPEIRREGRAHTLNQKSVARLAASELGKAYEATRLIVAHLGGGISIAAHSGGRMIDVTSARGEGAFCIDRTGGLNAYALAKLCVSGKYTPAQMLRKINGEGGCVAYLNTRDLREVEAMIDRGETKAATVFDALCYQIAKDIGAMATVLEGRIDAIILTGGMANSQRLVEKIHQRVQFLSRILIYPGENEMNALAQYLAEVQAGTLTPREYRRES